MFYKLKKILIVVILILQLFVNNKILAAPSTVSSIGTSEKIYAQSIKITNNSSKGIKLGESYQFKATITPNNVTDKTITWSSSDPSILSIDKNGKAVAKKKGTVKVTAKTSNGKTDSISVTVKKANTTTGELEKVKSVSITNNPKEMLVGDTFTLKTSISPHYVDDDTLAFKSSNTKVLKVDKNGKVTAVGKGTAKITATSNNGKKAEITIKVKNVKITLSDKSLNINKGDTHEITATIQQSKNYSVNSAKWTSTSTTNSTVKASGQTSNTYKAIVTAKNTGISTVKFIVDGEEESAQVKIVEAGKDKSLACPIITYDTSSNSQITINIQPASTTDHYDFATSTNKKSGSGANWNTKNQNLKGNQILYAYYTEAQGKIRIYGKEGTSRDCYTAPFDLNGSKNSGTSVFTFVHVAPSIKLNSKTQYINGAKSYKLNLYGSHLVTTGVRKAYLDISPAPNKDYQYSWYTNKNENTNSIGNWTRWQLYKTFNDPITVTLTTSSNNNYDRQGIVLAINDVGNVQITFTDIYSPLNFQSKTTVNATTDIYVEKGYSYNSNEMINLIKSLPKYYTATSNIFLLSSNTYQSLSGDSCGVAWLDGHLVMVRDGEGCDHDYAITTIIHELGHSMDAMYKKFNDRFINDENDMTNAYNSYMYKKNNGKYTYLREYSYSSKFEFWADIVKIKYLNNNSYLNNNYYKNAWTMDTNLNNLNVKYLNEVSNLYNKQQYDWNRYKSVYR